MDDQPNDERSLILDLSESDLSDDNPGFQIVPGDGGEDGGEGQGDGDQPRFMIGRHRLQAEEGGEQGQTGWQYAPSEGLEPLGFVMGERAYTDDMQEQVLARLMEAAQEDPDLDSILARMRAGELPDAGGLSPERRDRLVQFITEQQARGAQERLRDARQQELARLVGLIRANRAPTSTRSATGPSRPARRSRRSNGGCWSSMLWSTRRTGIR